MPRRRLQEGDDARTPPPSAWQSRTGFHPGQHSSSPDWVNDPPRSTRRPHGHADRTTPEPRAPPMSTPATTNRAAATASEPHPQPRHTEQTRLTRTKRKLAFHPKADTLAWSMTSAAGSGPGELRRPPAAAARCNGGGTLPLPEVPCHHQQASRAPPHHGATPA